MAKSQEQVEQSEVTDALLEGDEHTTEVDGQSTSDGDGGDEGGAGEGGKGKKPEADGQHNTDKGFNKTLQRVQQAVANIPNMVARQVKDLLEAQAERASQPSEEDEIAAIVEELGLDDPDGVVDVKTALKLAAKVGDAKTQRAVKKLREELAGQIGQAHGDPNAALEQYVTTTYEGDAQAIIDEARDLMQARVQDAGGPKAFGRAGMDLLAQQCLDQAAKNLGVSRKGKTPEKPGEKPKAKAKSKDGASHVLGGGSSDTGAVPRKQYKSAQAVLDDMLESGVNIELPT